MSLISMEFLTFVAVAVIGYYLIPKKYQWIWLLAFSYIYYASSGMKYLVFFVVYNSCNLWDRKNDLWSRSKVCQAERKDKNL